MDLPKIEKGIPLPARKSKGSLSALLRDMAPGDSVLVPRAQSHTYRARASNLKIKIAQRYENDNEVRIWKL